VDHLIQEIAPCSQGASCRNSMIVNPAGEKCSVCRLAPGNEDYEQQFWSGIKGTRHVVLDQERAFSQRKAARDKQITRMAKDRKRQKTLTKATKSEANTGNAIIKATVNSGRLYKDGDFSLADCITLDSKLQSNRLHPKVDLAELEKVGQDAKRVGNLLGALVLRNSNDVGVVVMKEEDFAVLISMWSKNVNKS
jgi:hypothetical protein